MPALHGTLIDTRVNGNSSTTVNVQSSGRSSSAQRELQEPQTEYTHAWTWQLGGAEQGVSGSDQKIFTMNASSSRDASLAITVRALDRGRVVEAYSDHLAPVGLCGSQVPVAAKGATRPGPFRKSGNGSAQRVNELDKILDAEAQTAVLAEHK